MEGVGGVEGSRMRGRLSCLERPTLNPVGLPLTFFPWDLLVP
jgi:hypothetical protein